MGFGLTGVSRPVYQKPSLFWETGSSLRAATFIRHIPSHILYTQYSFWSPHSRNILKIRYERRDLVAGWWKDKNSPETKLKRTARGTSLKRRQHRTGTEELITLARWQQLKNSQETLSSYCRQLCLRESTQEGEGEAVASRIAKPEAGW